MKVAFIGLGSIAKRHINNLYHIFENRNDEIQIDVFRSGSEIFVSPDVSDKITNTYQVGSDICECYDVIFITNPTSLHWKTLKEYQQYAKAFFIEKPVFDSGNIELHSLHLDCQKIYYVACPLRYMSVIQYIKSNIDFKKVYGIRAISSSYLPDWRPGVNYRNTYSARKTLGGGVAIDLIHEWDYLSYLIGFPLSIQSYIKHVSNLEIDSDDIAVYIADYGNKIVELHLDYIGRKPIRQLQLFSSEDTIVCDLIDSTIHYLKADQKISFKEVRNEYQLRELEYFLGVLEGTYENQNTIEHACQVLRLTEGKL